MGAIPCAETPARVRRDALSGLERAVCTIAQRRTAPIDILIIAFHCQCNF